jgi:hypothetical protein
VTGFNQSCQWVKWLTRNRRASLQTRLDLYLKRECYQLVIISISPQNSPKAAKNGRNNLITHPKFGCAADRTALEDTRLLATDYAEHKPLLAADHL